jgi:hypothetical protein
VPKHSDEDWQDPAKSMWITVTSIPSGAEVYSVSDGEPGALLGNTPLTLKFLKNWDIGESVMWQCPNPDAPLNEVFTYSYSKAMIQTADMPGSGSRSRTTAPIYRFGMDRNKATARFHCLVIKDGYKLYLAQDVFRSETGHTDTPHVVKGRKKYVAVLEPLE